MNQLPNKFYVLDTETTGLGDDDEIIEIALINQDGEAVLNTLIKPTQPIPAEATAIHGITDEMVADAPTWAEIEYKLSRLVWEKYVFIYNSQFDFRLWKQTSKKYSKVKYNILFYVKNRCVMTMAESHLCADRWVSLAKAAGHYNITFEGLTPHRAASDCAVTLDVLRAMYGLEPIATGELARKYEVVL